MIVPILDDGRLVVVRQYRYPVGRAMLEFPAGKIDPGEPTLACAVRELPRRPATVPPSGPAPACCTTPSAIPTEGIEVWFARGLTAGAAHLDAGEFLDTETLAAAELDRLAGSGELTDAKTLIGLLWLQRAVGASVQQVRAPQAPWPLRMAAAPGADAARHGCPDNGPMKVSTCAAPRPWLRGLVRLRGRLRRAVGAGADRLPAVRRQPTCAACRARRA